jgi:hypothetical protein
VDDGCWGNEVTILAATCFPRSSSFVKNTIFIFLASYAFVIKKEGKTVACLYRLGPDVRPRQGLQFGRTSSDLQISRESFEADCSNFQQFWAIMLEKMIRVMTYPVSFLIITSCCKEDKNRQIMSILHSTTTVDHTCCTMRYEMTFMIHQTMLLNASER